MGGKKAPQSNHQNAILSLEAKWLKYAFAYDPILAVSVAKVDPLPHQIEAVYGSVLKKSSIRFMLAHDPGAGKTIMAGLIIKELKMRHEIQRILIVVPGQLKEQWRWEMQDKFDEKFDIVDRKYFDRNGKSEAWGGDQLITSIDFAKQNDIISSMDGHMFDMVIVDEAHKLSAYSYGNTVTKTNRYKLGEALSKISRHLLFLTATPHKGDMQNFRLLLDLLEPGFFSTDEMMHESIRAKNNPLFLRRAKEDMKDFSGRSLFVQRSVKTPEVTLSRPEVTLYNKMSKYINEQYNLATQSVKQHNIVFALIILQRRFASSTFALLQSLKRRKGKLEQLERDALALDAGQEGPPAGVPDYVDSTEKEQWDEEEKWELITVAKNRDELRKEIGIIDDLISKASGIIRKGSEAKLVQLRNTLEQLGREYPDKKVLVFTESKDTMSYLASKIEMWGYSVNVIHGAMPPDDRKKAEDVFRTSTRVMVATEAAGEGINLQFCHLMINYDLPWNPNRLEQRMGRIHRYGQDFPVSVFNLVAANTREGEIMQTLFEKLNEIKTAMGSDKVFDVISEVIEGKSLAQLMLDATVKSRRQSDILSDLSDMVSDSSHITEYMKDSLATRYMDYNALRSVRDQARERRLMPDYTRDIFQRILESAGGSMSGDDPVSLVIPDRIRDAGDGIKPAYAEATFDKRIRMSNPGVELVTFGHPAFDAALKWAEGGYSEGALDGTVFADPNGRIDGHLVFCEGSVVDGTERTAGKKIVACLVDRKGNASSISPSVLLDLAREPVAGEPWDGSGIAESALSKAREIMGEYMEQIAQERGRSAALMRKYGMESLDANLEKINRDIVGMLSKKRRGVKMDLPISVKRESRKKYRKARIEMRRRLASEGSLRVRDVSVAGAIQVVPASANAAKLGRAALSAAAKLERSSGRVPDVVSGTGCGFDIRSTVKPRKPSRSRAAVRPARQAPDPSAKEPVRYILAKAADSEGRFMFTFNEWFRARILGDDYYLYLYRDGKVRQVRNPARELKAWEAKSGYMAVA